MRLVAVGLSVQIIAVPQIHELFLAAAREGNIPYIKELIAEKADVNRGKVDHTPLGLASFAGHKEIVDLLLEAGAEVDAQTGANDGTALMLAVHQGHTEVVKRLLQAGACINARSGHGYSVLAYAITNGSAGLIKLLTDAGAVLEPELNNSITNYSEESSGVESTA
jgi:ankyrin repeat protein